MQCPTGLLVHEWSNHPYLAIPLGLCQGLLPSSGITGPAVSAGAGTWCATATTSFSSPRGQWGGFLGQQIWSHSRYCLFAPDKLPRKALSQKWEDAEPQEQCSGITRWREGAMVSWKRSGDRGEQKPLRAQEEPLLGWAALSKCATNICFTLTKLC